MRIKKTTLLFISLCLLIISISLLQCKKSTVPLNITLSDKPVSVTSTYIQGKWRVHYMYGGFCGACIFNRESYNEYYEFSSDSNIKYTYQNSVKVDTGYTWFTYQMSNWDYIHNIIQFYDKNSMLYHYEPIKIVNDTLVLAEPYLNTPDYDLLYMTKVK